jgi:hypothetical protein
MRESSENKKTRRGFLAASTLVSTAMLAGCSSTYDTESSFTVPAPNIPQSQLRNNGWEQAADSSTLAYKESFLAGLVTVTARERTRVFEDKALQEDIRNKTLGRVDTSLSTFFATRIAIEPNINNLPLQVGLSEILHETEQSAKSQLEKQLNAAGLANITEQSAGSLQIKTGGQANLTKYSAEYQFNDITVPVTNKRNLMIPGGALEVAGWLASWSHGDFLFVSGGAYPSENFTRSISEDITEAMTVTVDIDLGFQPHRYKEELYGLMTSVS